MKQSLTFLADEELELQAQVKRFSWVLIINGSLYPFWARIHYLVNSEAVDSYWERAGIYGLILLLVAIARFSRMRPQHKMNMLVANRWLFLGHYFTLAARNHLAFDYSIGVFFLTFFCAAAFERPRSFLPFALFAGGMSMFCESHDPRMPTIFFRATIITCLMLSYLNIRRRYQLTLTIRNNAKMLKDMFTTAGVGMALLDIEGRVIAANQALAKTFATPAGKLVGKRLEDFSADVSSSQLQSGLADLWARKTPALNLEQSFRDSWGQVVWGKVSASLITSSSSFVLALVEDINLQKATELLVRDRQEKMYYSARMAALGEMAGGIAHEINNPLAIIDGMADVLGNKFSSGEIDPEFTRDALGRIRKMTDRIAKIIRGLRSFSRDGSGDPLQVCSAKEILQNALDLCEEKLKTRNINLRVAEVPEDCMMKCRGVEVSQVLLNLLNNAFDAVADEPVKWISVELEKEEKFVRFNVGNSGPAVPVSLRQKIFQPFFTTKPVGQGVGLGLSISLGIMRSQGGSIFLDLTKPNTCFSVRVPRA